jgi:hypothetical protein
MNSSGEFDAAFAATIAAAAFAIAAREEKLAAQKKSVPIEEVPRALSLVKRAGSTKKPAGGNKISRWFSGKEPLEHDDDGPGSVNMFYLTRLLPFFCHLYCSKTGKPLVTMLKWNVLSVSRPLKPAPGKPEGMPADHKVAPKILETSLSVRKGSGSSGKTTDRKGSKKFEQEHVQKAPSIIRPSTSYHSRRNGEDAAGVAAIGGTRSKADEWEKAKLAKVREE